jgi:hypothetical protein
MAWRSDVVTRWFDWVDDVLGPSVSEPVVLHGDFHGYNVVVDRTATVKAVLDFEEASVGDHHYDFRYLPAQAPTLDLFLATVDAYELIAERAVAVDRVMGWHIRTVLGDALWRTGARVALPGGGTPQQWIDELELRMTALETTLDSQHPTVDGNHRTAHCGATVPSSSRPCRRLRYG